MTQGARPDPQAFYGVATVSLPVFAVLATFSALTLIGGGLGLLAALWVPALVVAGVLVARYRWRAVAGLSVGLVLGVPMAYLALLVVFGAYTS